MNSTIETTAIEDVSEAIKKVLPSSPSLAALVQLQTDIAQDYYTIVTVGEFKHGKSTMVNALLGENWMPVDVTPTTALIHTVFYGETPEIHIVRSGQETEILPLEALAEFSAGSEKVSEEIDYIKIFLPSPLLKERVVLVDTPGLNDLNTHRSAVTEKFIPRADAVLFTLDLRAPLSETEFEFLETMKDKQGIQSIIFPANFADALEVDEIDDTVRYIERRLSKLELKGSPSIIPISAKEGMLAKQEKDMSLLEYSGIPALETAMKNLLEAGHRQANKQRRNHFRLTSICNAASIEAEEVLFIMNASTDELKVQMESISEWLGSRHEWTSELDIYIEERCLEIENIAIKSLYYYSSKLKKQIFNRITLFNGVEIDHFINTELPLTIQNGFENWLDQYAIHFKELFSKLEEEMSKGLSHAFEEDVKVKTDVYKEISLQDSTSGSELHFGNSNLKAGVLVGGASVVAFLLGATIVAPIMGMVALPFIQKKIQNDKLKKVKPEFQITMDAAISEVTTQIANNLRVFIQDNVANIRKASQDEFEKKLKFRAGLIEDQLFEKEGKQVEIRHKKDELLHLIKYLKENDINGLYEQ